MENKRNHSMQKYLPPTRLLQKAKFTFVTKFWGSPCSSRENTGLRRSNNTSLPDRHPPNPKKISKSKNYKIGCSQETEERSQLDSSRWLENVVSSLEIESFSKDPPNSSKNCPRITYHFCSTNPSNLKIFIKIISILFPRSIDRSFLSFCSPRITSEKLASF